MTIKEISIPKESALDLSQFKEMDYFAVENYSLPIELMMENAGLHLAHLVSQSTTSKKAKILIGIGNGNNGGGGLVAARRLAAWGYQVNLHAFTPITKELPKNQLKRAIKFGAKNETIKNPDIWVDAYLGFSQRLPLTKDLLKIIDKANSTDCIKISLDIPTGYLGDLNEPYFKSSQVMSLAAAKKLLYQLPEEVELYVADLGIPKEVYEQFNSTILPFQQQHLLKIKR